MAITTSAKALLTPELLQEIARHLDPASLVAATQVSRFWKAQCEPLVWGSLSATDWPLLLQSSSSWSGPSGLTLPAPHLVRHLQLHSRGVQPPKKRSDLSCITTVPVKTFHLSSTNLTHLVQSCRHLRSLEIHITRPHQQHPFFFSSGSPPPPQVLLEGLGLELLDNAVLGSLAQLESLNLSVDHLLVPSQETRPSPLSLTSATTTTNVLSKQPLVSVERLLQACPQLHSLSLCGPIFSLRQPHTLSTKCDPSRKTTTSAARKLRTVRLQEIAMSERELLWFLDRHGHTLHHLDLSESLCWPWTRRFAPAFARACPRLCSLTLSCAKVPFSSSHMAWSDQQDGQEQEEEEEEEEEEHNEDDEEHEKSGQWKTTTATALTDAQLAELIRALWSVASDLGGVPNTTTTTTTTHSSSSFSAPPLPQRTLEAFAARSCYIGQQTLAALAATEGRARSLRHLDLSMPRKPAPPTMAMITPPPPLSSPATATSTGPAVVESVPHGLHAFLCCCAPNLERLEAEGMYLQLLELLDNDDSGDDDEEEEEEEESQGGCQSRPARGWACRHRLESLTVGFSAPVGPDAPPLPLPAADAPTNPEVEEEAQDEHVHGGNQHHHQHHQQQQQHSVPSIDHQLDAAWRLLASLRRLQHLKITNSTLDLSLALVDDLDASTPSTPSLPSPPPTPPMPSSLPMPAAVHRAKGLARLAALGGLESVDWETCTPHRGRRQRRRHRRQWHCPVVGQAFAHQQTQQEQEQQQALFGPRQLAWMGRVWPRLRLLRLPSGSCAYLSTMTASARATTTTTTTTTTSVAAYHGTTRAMTQEAVLRDWFLQGRRWQRRQTLSSSSTWTSQKMLQQEQEENDVEEEEEEEEEEEDIQIVHPTVPWGTMW